MPRWANWRESWRECQGVARSSALASQDRRRRRTAYGCAPAARASRAARAGENRSSKTKRRGDASEGAEVGAIAQHEHVGRLPHGGLDGLLEHARARFELFPVHRAALGVDAHPAAARADPTRSAHAPLVEERLDASLDERLQDRREADGSTAVAVSRVVLAQVGDDDVLAGALLLCERRLGGTDNVVD